MYGVDDCVVRSHPHPRIEYGAGSSPRVGARGKLSPTTGEGIFLGAICWVTLSDRTPD